MSIDKYFERQYNAASYNCAHFSIEVYRDLTGKDAGDILHGLLCRPSLRRADMAALRRVRFLDRPASPCFVYMHRRRQRLPHVGIWYKGAVLHLLECSKVQYMPLEVAAFGYNKVRFFDVD